LQSASVLHGSGGAAQIPQPDGWPFGLHDMNEGQSLLERHWTGPSASGPASAGHAIPSSLTVHVWPSQDAETLHP
jgi:hypothetical protein